MWNVRRVTDVQHRNPLQDFSREQALAQLVGMKSFACYSSSFKHERMTIIQTLLQNDEALLEKAKHVLAHEVSTFTLFDRLDDSLRLMADTFCWDPQSIAKNTRLPPLKENPPPTYTPTVLRIAQLLPPLSQCLCCLDTEVHASGRCLV